ncbi:MAG: hypothetical protein V1895_00490 [Parcubacteria group bacterium]
MLPSSLRTFGQVVLGMFVSARAYFRPAAMAALGAQKGMHYAGVEWRELHSTKVSARAMLGRSQENALEFRQALLITANLDFGAEHLCSARS